MSDKKTQLLEAAIDLFSKEGFWNTEASSGNGKEIAKQLLRDGFVVYTAARRIETMDDLKELGAIPLKMDVTNDEEVAATVATITL